jgi:hypothetical protein
MSAHVRSQEQRRHVFTESVVSIESASVVRSGVKYMHEVVIGSDNIDTNTTS